MKEESLECVGPEIRVKSGRCEEQREGEGGGTHETEEWDHVLDNLNHYSEEDPRAFQKREDLESSETVEEAQKSEEKSAA